MKTYVYFNNTKFFKYNIPPYSYNIYYTGFINREEINEYILDIYTINT